MIVLQCAFQGIVATVLSMLAYLKAISLLGTERAAAFLAQALVGLAHRAKHLLQQQRFELLRDRARAGLRVTAGGAPQAFRALRIERQRLRGKFGLQLERHTRPHGKINHLP